MIDMFTAATAKVRRMLTAGYLPWVAYRKPTAWAHPDGGDGGPVTPPEGVVLDQLVYLDTDSQDGPMHFHSYLGARIRHGHQGGATGHQHHWGEDRPSWPLGVVAHREEP